MIMKKKTGERKMLILLHDGVHWHAGLRKDGGVWMQMQENASKVELLPESILEWGAEKGALLVRVALPSELHEIELENAGMIVLTAAEIYEILSFELSDKTGMEATAIAPSLAPCTALGMGSDEKRLIGTAFERDMLFGFHEGCQQYGMKFDGVASLQGLALASHAASRENDRETLLFLGEKDSFVVGHAGDERQVTLRTIPVGCPGGERSADYDRRLERRIKPYLNHAVHLVAPSTGTIHAEHCVHDIKADCDLHTSGFNEHRIKWMTLLAAAPRYLLEGPVALVGLPPKVKDEKYTGGIICAATLGLTLLVLGSLWGSKAIQKCSLEKRHADIQTLEQAQNGAQSAFDSVDSELKRIRKLHASLSQSPPKVGGHYTDIITALAETLPKYARITSVVQNNDRTTIAGSTIWVQELSGFSVALQKELSPYNLSVVPKTKKPDPASGETVFILEILHARP